MGNRRSPKSCSLFNNTTDVFTGTPDHNSQCEGYEDLACPFLGVVAQGHAGAL